MTAKEKEKIVDRINKLLSLSESSNPNEAKLAFQKAEKLMKEYAISQAQVKNGKNDVQIISDFYETPRKGRPYELSLASSILRVFGVECIQVPFKQKRGSRLELFGTKSDITTAKIMLDYAFGILVKMKKDRKEKITKGTVKLNGDSAKVNIHAYLTGLALGMQSTVQEIYKNQQAEANKQSEYGLVLVDRAKKANAFMKEKFPNIGNARRQRVKATESFRSGQADGKKVGFSKQVNGNGTKKKALPAKAKPKAKAKAKKK
tara:strand:- start:5165 stop:5947 length:783 start_codon:yes stop_codon:yes gene_type:complete